MLARFPLEVVEALAAFLRDHHFARLYMAGDTRLQQLLVHIRSRQSDVAGIKTMHSALIRQFIVGRATDVTARLQHVDLEGLATNSPRMKRLRITRRSLYGNLDVHLDLSNVSTLESFEIDDSYVVLSSLKLPISITSVKIGSAACAKPIHQLESLTRLKRLSITFFHDHSHASRAFFESVTWPTSLDRLSVSMKGASHLVHALPSTLTRLSLTLHKKSAPVELADLTFTMPLLTSLRLRDGPAKMNVPLPSALKTIKIDTLVVDAGKTLLEAFRLLPLSVTDFSCQTLLSDTVDGDLAVEDLQAAVGLILPRLTLENMENFAGVLSDMALSEEIFSDDGFLTLFEEVCVKHGLRGGYMNDQLPRWRPRTSQESIGNIVMHAVSDEDAIRIARTRKRVCGDEACGKDSRVTTVTVAACLKMLDLGLTHILDLPFKTHGLETMSARAIHNLVRVRLHVDVIDAFIKLVKRVALVCLEVIDIKSKTQTDRILLSIHACRHNLPRLEQILLSPKRHYGPTKVMVDPIALDMHMFMSGSNKLVYRVTWRPSQLSSRLMIALIGLASTFVMVGSFVFLLYKVIKKFA